MCDVIDIEFEFDIVQEYSDIGWIVLKTLKTNVLPRRDDIIILKEKIYSGSFGRSETTIRKLRVQEVQFVFNTHEYRRHRDTVYYKVLVEDIENSDA